MAKDTFYFSHDFNARNDIKIKKLIAKHGYLGYGLFWAIIEELYNNTNVLPNDYDCISFDLRCDAEVVKSIINDFDLFVVDAESFGSLSIQRRLNERNEKSKKARESVLARWNKQKEDTNVLPTNYDSNTIKERKGKENKVNESKENKENNISALPFSFYNYLINYGFDKNLVSDWIKVRKNKKASNTETAYNSFIKEIEKRNCNLNEILELIVVKNWSGFKWEWYDNENNKEKSSAKKESEQIVAGRQTMETIQQNLDTTGLYVPSLQNQK